MRFCGLRPESNPSPDSLLSGPQPTIKRHPWTASRRDIPPTYQTRDRTQFRAIGISNATSNDMRGSKPYSYDRQRPRDRRNRHAEKNPCQREPSGTGDYSCHPLTACDCVRRDRIFANRALGTVRHLHAPVPHTTSLIPSADCVEAGATCSCGKCTASAV